MLRGSWDNGSTRDRVNTINASAKRTYCRSSINAGKWGEKNAKNGKDRRFFRGDNYVQILQLSSQDERISQINMCPRVGQKRQSSSSFRECFMNFFRPLFLTNFGNQSSKMVKKGPEKKCGIGEGRKEDKGCWNRFRYFIVFALVKAEFPRLSIWDRSLSAPFVLSGIRSLFRSNPRDS